jgi:hypothetical protein
MATAVRRVSERGWTFLFAGGGIALVVGDTTNEYNLTTPETIGSEVDPFTWISAIDPPPVVMRGQGFYAEWRCETTCTDETITVSGITFRAI